MHINEYQSEKLLFLCATVDNRENYKYKYIRKQLPRKKNITLSCLQYENVWHRLTLLKKPYLTLPEHSHVHLESIANHVGYLKYILTPERNNKDSKKKRNHA